jgi:hypothetical protein
MIVNQEILFIALFILILLLLTCHISNFLYPSNNTKNRNDFNNYPPIQYNDIYYYGQPGKNICNTLNDSQAQIPCIVRSQCTPQHTKYQLSQSEIAMLYKFAYEEAGREILRRELKIANNNVISGPSN